jgi:hypothetical protein
MSYIPSGEEREVRRGDEVTVDGAPISHVIVLAAVVTALSALPFSLILSAGGAFPLSQAIYPLVGWILGPLAGAVASGTGALVGIFLFPHTAGPIPALRPIAAALASFTAGTLYLKGKRSWWWVPLALLFTLAFTVYLVSAMVNQVELWAFLVGTTIDWTGLLLYLLPTRVLFGRWLGNEDPRRLVPALFVGTWMVSGLSHLALTGLIYYPFLFKLPQETFLYLAVVSPLENLVRSGVGTAIGTGVILGLRAVDVVKPREALY